MKLSAWCCGLLMLLVASPNAAERLNVRVSPATAFEPADVTIQTLVEPDADNMAMQVIAESDTFYRSSLVQLDGEHAPRAASFRFGGLPAGQYEVHVVLIGRDGRERAFAKDVFFVS